MRSWARARSLASVIRPGGCDDNRSQEKEDYVSNEAKQSVAMTLIDEVEKELERLTKLNAELREYACHAPVCVVDNVRDLTNNGCDCGLAQLLEKMK